MIATLTGQITEKLPDSLIVEAGGVGYELICSVADWGAAAPGHTAKFYIYEQIREDAHNLFGFQALDDRQLFTQLISVSGVGPKLAMQIISAASASRVRQAIASGDPDLLKGVSGVGPKTASRVIVELKGKISADSVGLAPVADPAYQALVSLGYTPPQAAEAVASLPPDVTDSAERIKLALKHGARS